MVDILEKYLILETVEQTLTDAIHNHQRVTLHYKGFKGTPDPKTGKMRGKTADKTAPGMRIVLPVALGVDKRSGALVVRALVTSSGVHTAGRDRPTKWRMFRVDRITSVIPREGEDDLNNPIPADFHENDKMMSVIYAQASDTEVAAPEGEKPMAPPTPAPPPTGGKLDKVPAQGKAVLKTPKPEVPPVVTAMQKPAPKEIIKAEKPKPAPEKPVTPPPAPTPVPSKPEPVKPEPDEEEGMLGLSEAELVKPILEWNKRLNKILK